MTSEDAGPAAAEPAKKKHLPIWQETLLLLVVAVVLAVVIKALFVQAFYIPSPSMEPGLVKDDKILVQKPSYWFGGGPQRGDVVVFKDPGGWLPPAAAGTTGGLSGLLSKIGLYPVGGHLVKRVIGVEGDTIVCCDDQGRIEVNGVPLDEEDYARPDENGCYGPMPEGGECDWTAGPVPEGEVFVMGDNRDHSADSSHHLCEGVTDCTDYPFIDADDVVGKVFVLMWPRERFGFLHRPDTFDDVPDAS